MPYILPDGRSVATPYIGDSISLTIDMPIPISSFSNIIFDVVERNSGNCVANISLNPIPGYDTTSVELFQLYPNRIRIGVDSSKTKNAISEKLYYLHIETITTDSIFLTNVDAKNSCVPFVIFKNSCN